MPWRYRSTSRRKPSGNVSQASFTAGFTAGTANRVDGQSGTCPTFTFQARANSRRNASSEGLPTRERYAMRRSTTASSTSVGAIWLAEQKRINDDNRQRTSRSLIRPRSSSQAGAQGAPCSGTPFSRASHSSALFALLLWFCSVLAVRPAGAW